MGSTMGYTVAFPRAPDKMLTYAKTTDTLLCDVVHDLRQPLSNIEISAYLLKKMLGDSQGQAREYVSAIERQIDDAVRILNEAAAAWGRFHAQPAEAESLD